MRVPGALPVLAADGWRHDTCEVTIINKMGINQRPLDIWTGFDILNIETTATKVLGAIHMYYERRPTSAFKKLQILMHDRLVLVLVLVLAGVLV